MRIYKTFFKGLNKKYLTLSLFFLLIGLTANLKAADTTNILSYKVHISLDNVDNFNKARSVSIEKNRSLALEESIKKIISSRDYGNLKSLLNKEIVSFYEDRIAINNENMGDNGSYSVDITYYFNLNKVKDFLKRGDIKYVLELDNKVLVISILDNKLDFNSEIYGYFLSDKDLFLSEVNLTDESYNLDLQKILAIDNSYLSEIKQKYSVNTIVIVASSSVNDTKDGQIVKIIYNDNSGKYKIVQVNGVTSKESIVNTTLNTIEEEQKEKSIKEFSDKNSKTFTVEFNSFVDWVTMYKNLKDISQIEKIKIEEIDLNSVTVDIHYYGDFQDIVKALKIKNISINEDDYTIKCNSLCY